MLGSLNPLSPRLTRGPTGQIFPSGMTVHLPLTDGLTPIVGGGGATVITRASTKRQQNAANTFVVHGNNVLLPTSQVYDISAKGLHIELARTNDIAAGGSDDMSIGGFNWSAVNCAVSAKNVTDPSGAANEAQTLTPSGDGGGILNSTGVACSGKNAFFSVWLRRAGGASGSQTGIVTVSDTSLYVTASKNITITDAWQCFYVEYSNDGGNPGGAETLAIGITPESAGQSPVDARMPFVEVFANTSIKTILTPALTSRSAEIANYDCSGDIRGDIGTLYCEVVPLHAPEDGLNHAYIAATALNGLGTYNMFFYKNSANNLLVNFAAGGNQFTSAVAANDTTWARGARHKLAIRYSSAGVNFYYDGTAGGTRGATTVGDASPAAASRFSIGSFSGSQAEAVVGQARYWPVLLTDAEMARITR